ncbi:DUF1326 domain-containing protein [Sorangium sp. So ce119]|uniref:DUF1326 domain-containing protein n=1 Tax=Sorangium sp. So ce119 TaxID=3133279 RepID=UPI003F618F70
MSGDRRRLHVLPCPCTFAQPSTHGDCLFTLVWQIHEGHHADVDLSGLAVVSIGEFNAPGADVGPGQVATWGVVEDDLTVGFDFSHPYEGGSSKHFPFDWRPRRRAGLARLRSVASLMHRASVS